MRLLAAAFLLALSGPAIAQPLALPGPLHGTLLAAGKGAPAVLTLAGSGPTDRDGNSPAGLHSDSYKLLAQGMAAHGIASLRVDKRGIGESALAMTAEGDLRLQTYVDDAKAWAAELRKRTGNKCVWLLGHSEGALVAEVAAQDGTGICGVILVSGIGRKLGDVIRAQVAANPANPPIVAQTVNGILVRLEAGQSVADVPPFLLSLFRPSVQPYLISEVSRDPAALLAKIKLPVLILQGDTDIQVSVEDAHLLAAAKPDARLVILPGVNHILKVAPADRAANAATYANPNLPLAPGIVEAVADFVRSHTP